ncbi:ATP-binding protein [Streptomyces sp. NBC_00847]|uniref:ATP-binding protein n=1 Tax=Streptomyces sp. NBC_00847 TaxID=2975850 RepID=UPI00225E228C|nr:ATP-binding protein [Streptomyces sp. NBC_00847]MCX4885593.1 ATP-binding protein [Streptomyces sp. NBC_00847]
MTASRAQRHAPSPSPAHDEDRTVADLPTGHVLLAKAGAKLAGTDVPTSANEVLRSTFPADPSWAAAVRRTVTERLAELLPHSEQLDDAAMATGELFANAVRHASRGPGDTVAVVIECTEHTLRVVVSDRSPVLPRPRAVDEAAESGRGLAIVSALTDGWGTAPPEPGTPGKRVWFTIKRLGAAR